MTTCRLQMTFKQQMSLGHRCQRSWWFVVWNVTVRNFVATQVGVDVVEATLMVVEHAERFGLAALHQLRGRVGRGGRKSHCYLITPERRALQRLRIMERSQDGFLIAQADLEHRHVIVW